MAQSPSGVLLAFLLASAFISMWMSNTAATAMMLPLALGVIARTGLPADAPSNFARGLILAIAYGSTIGGMATPIGTPPNALVLSGLEKAGLPRIDFLSWMAVGVPVMLVLVPVTWAMLLYLFPPEVKAMAGGKEALERERGALGPLSAGERGTVGVFVTLVFLWVSLSLMPVTLGRLAPWLDEYLIGLLGGVALFVFPAGENRTVLSWRDAQSIDWGTLLLFGGGITLSDAMFRTGVAQWLADGVLGFIGAAPPTWLLVATLLLLVELLSELTSNTAIAAAMVPIGIAVAQQAHCDPILAAMGVGLAASLGFMLPISTPPNAIAYGSGRVSMRDMMRAGVLLDLLSWITVTAVLLGLAPLFVGVKP
jgi:sodium-dependent dicarboxylate transporter 2/3/5